LTLAMAACSSGESAQSAPSLLPAPTPPERFSFGSPADPARVAAWDVDVRADGVGLPAGSGNVEQGERVFQQRCASCHGAAGSGGAGGQLVGRAEWVDTPPTPKTVGSYWPYATTLYDYMVRAMPQDAPGTLSANDTYAVIAYILNKNEIVPADAVMNATTLPAVMMPARNKFVVDNRTGGPVIR
jgi:mono/diheme cytochrome c family protein